MHGPEIGRQLLNNLFLWKTAFENYFTVISIAMELRRPLPSSCFLEKGMPGKSYKSLACTASRLYIIGLLPISRSQPYTVLTIRFTCFSLSKQSLNVRTASQWSAEALLCCLSFACVGNPVVDAEIVKVHIATRRFSSIIEQPETIPHEVWQGVGHLQL